MQNAKTAAAEKPGLERAKPRTLRKRIGSTVYEVSVYFSETNKETIENKIERLIEREAVINRE